MGYYQAPNLIEKDIQSYSSLLEFTTKKSNQKQNYQAVPEQGTRYKQNSRTHEASTELRQALYRVNTGWKRKVVPEHCSLTSVC
ncbi:hypothetical protein L1887_39852 [Cichorium endivia]|nr:hypothetical protein L1887_39852 [Cichorium endivia]